MKPKIFVSTYPFARKNLQPLRHLQNSGFEIVLNPLNRKISGRELLQCAAGCDGIIAGTEDLTDLVVNNDQLKIISRVGIGLDSVPLNLCKEKNIIVTYTPDAVTYAVAELTLGLMLNLTRFVYKADVHLRIGEWNRFEGMGINESVIGIVGFGRIGKKVARLLEPFDPVKILVNDLLEVDLSEFENLNIEIASKDKIFLESDIVTLHIPASESNKNLVNKEVLNMMKPNSLIINTARGGLVNESDLFEVLKTKRIQGAALDVFQEEPYVGSLTTLDNIILTQHMGSCTNLARLNMELEAAEDIVRFFKGELLQNMVPETEYGAQQGP